MRRINRFRPSPAAIIACIALLVALAGTSFAAGPAIIRSSAETPANAYSTYVNGPLSVPGTWQKFASLTIPQAGKYVAWGKAFFTASRYSGLTNCMLQAGNDSDQSSGEVPAALADTLSLNVVHTFVRAGTVDLSCKSGGAVSIKSVKVTAIRVASLTNTPG